MPLLFHVDFTRLVLWFLPFLALGVLFIVWSRRRRNVYNGNQIPCISGIPFLYTLGVHFIKYSIEKVHVFHPTDYFLSMVDGLSQLYFKGKMIKSAWGGRQYIVCFEPATSEKVFNSSAALNKDWIYNFLHNWLGTGLLTSGNDKWRTRRKMLTPAFHFRILKDFLLIFNEHSMILVAKLKKCSGQEVNINEPVALCTLDIIGESAMGVHLNAQGNGDTEYVQAVNKKGANSAEEIIVHWKIDMLLLTAMLIKWFATPWYWISPIFNLTSAAKHMKRDLVTVHDFARKVILDRKAKLLEEMENSEAIESFEEDKEDIGLRKRRAFLDLLLYHHITDKSLSMEDIREEVDTFTFEGHDTTSMGISWTLYLLGLHKEIQEKVYQETRNIFGEDKERSVTTDDLKEMKYLECVIKETLRLYPSVPIIVRRTTEDIKADQYTIPANSSVAIIIYSIHHNPTIFPNPEAFNPDRFLQENCLGRHPFAYVPFSAGQRNCIGQRFAMMELKTVVSNILRNFKIHSLDQRDKLILIGDIILRSKYGLRLVLEKR